VKEWNVMVRTIVRWFLPMITGMHRFIFYRSGHRWGWSAAGFQFLVLESVGRKTGLRRETPLLYVPHGDNWLIAASNAGQPSHPVWWLNLRAQPEVFIRTKQGRFPVEARRASGSEEELWSVMIDVMPWFENYRAGTERQIPLIVLAPRVSAEEEIAG